MSELRMLPCALTAMLLLCIVSIGDSRVNCRNADLGADSGDVEQAARLRGALADLHSVLRRNIDMARLAFCTYHRIRLRFMRWLRGAM